MSKRPLLLHGKVVQPDGTAPERFVLVKDGKIDSLGEERPAVPENTVVVDTGAHDWIFPGLLDLHTHSTYNLLPLWSSPLAPFDNRFEWRADPGYREEVKGTYQHFDPRKNPEFSKVLAVAAELQAVAGGTTVLQEDTDLDRELGAEHGLVLCRDTAKPEDLLAAGSEKILSVLQFFAPDEYLVPRQQWALDRYLKDRRETRDGQRLQATLAHLAEGRSGCGHHRGKDPYCRREFEAFMRHPAFRDADAVRQSPMGIIHGSGIDTADREHLDFLLERDISIVWSPVSNLLLYGDTLDVETLLDAGVNVALGSDWSPSGSKHVWDEAKFARFYLDAIGSSVSDARIFGMATVAAGRCLGLPRLGRLEPGGLADFFILRCPRDTEHPFEVFFSTTDRHVRATLIGGRPIYGDEDFLAAFDLELQPLPAVEGSAVAGKAVHLPRRLGVDLDRDLGRFESFLKELPEPVKRSNLLASSDKIYRRRIQELKAKVAGFAWSVQEWRAKGPSKTPGAVPVGAGSVRVWRGFRAAGVDPGDFRRRLGETAIPATVQTQAPLGMTAFLPTVLPADKPGAVPDEVALVFYESKKTHARTFESVAGRADRLLHRPLFEPGIRTAFPRRLGDELVADQPYYLLPGKADWHLGTCHVLVGTPAAGEDPDGFRVGVLEILGDLRDRRPPGLDGAIVSVSDDYLVYWEHWAEPGHEDAGALGRLRERISVVLSKEARPAKIPADLDVAYGGLEIAGGECLNVRFVRRRLFPR